MKLMLQSFVFCVIIIAFANCTSTKKIKPNQTSMQEATTTATSLTGTYWKLTELMGKPAGPTPADKKEVHMILTLEGNKVEGFGGCNGFGGTFETKNNFNIAFHNIISTMIACPDLDQENQLFNVLRTADNYYVVGDTLSLSKARMATMARFTAVRRP